MKAESLQGERNRFVRKTLRFVYENDNVFAEQKSEKTYGNRRERDDAHGLNEHALERLPFFFLCQRRQIRQNNSTDGNGENA